MDDIVELRFNAMDCHIRALKCDDPLQKARLHAEGVQFTAMADKAVRALNPPIQREPARAGAIG
jgi:hypothetical protein